MKLHFKQGGIHRVVEIDVPFGVLSHADALQALKSADWVVDDDRMLIVYK